MLGFFKKKTPTPALAAILKLRDREFVAIVERMMTDGPLAAGTMCLVALENLAPLMNAAFAAGARSPGKRHLPRTLDDYITSLADSIEKHDEPARRRAQWLYLAALVKRVTVKSLSKPELADSAASIWVRLAQSGSLIAETVPGAELWSEDEKASFRPIGNELEGIRYVLLHMLPPNLSDHPRIQDFAAQAGIPLSAVLRR